MFSDNDDSIKLGEGDKDKEKKKKDSAKVNTMPDVFYGGKDPEIYEEKNKAKQKLKKKSENSKEKQKKEKGKQKNNEQEQKDKKQDNETKDKSRLSKAKIIAGIASFLLIVGAVSAYQFYNAGYFNFSQELAQEEAGNNQQQQQEDSEPSNSDTTTDTNDEQNQPTTSTDDQQVATSTTSTEQTEDTTSTLVAQPLEFPSSILADSVDLDSDELTDQEEVLFDTDSGTWDTDGDGYFDGQEVLNLYDPNQESPTKLIDSGVIDEYVNPVYGYRLYHPSDWEVAAVDDEYKQVLFSSIDGAFVEVRAESKQEGESFEDWFARKAEGQSIQEIESFSNRFEQEGYKRQDNLVAYFNGSNNNVYVMIYNKGTNDSISFRRSMRMMFQSFRLNMSNTGLPEQNVIPKAETTTTSSINTQDKSNTSSTSATSNSESIQTTTESNISSSS